MAETNNSGIVYLLTNPAMQDLVKIGRTNNGVQGVEERMNSLYNTKESGVPLPFECEFV